MSVPVLSKQQTSTRPAKGIRNGSVQKIAILRISKVRKRETGDEQYFDRATREALTARESSIGSSGGTTDVMMMTQSSNSFERFRSCSTPTQRRISNNSQERKERSTFDPDVSRSGDGEDEQETNEEETLDVVGGDGLR